MFKLLSHFRSAFQFVVFIAALGAPLAAVAANRDVCPTCPYTTVGDALFQANSGDHIRVAGGEYPGFSTNRDNFNVEISGGWDEAFLVQDQETIIKGGITVSLNNRGNLTIDRVSVTKEDGGQGSNGIFVWSPNTNVVIRRCKLYNNPYSGLTTLGVGDLIFEDNEVFGNGSGEWGNLGGVVVSSSYGHGVVTIRNNQIHNNVCLNCFGIILEEMTGADSIVSNEIRENTRGIGLRTTGQPEVAYNIVAGQADFSLHESTAGAGVIISGQGFNFHHNLVYNNEYVGLQSTTTANPKITSNTFAFNGIRGAVYFTYGAGNPLITNNILYKNARGFEFSYGLWSPSSVVPEALAYNIFFQNTYGAIMHSGVPPAFSYFDEELGTWAGFNGLRLDGRTWSYNNYSVDPGFEDPEHGDFRLEDSSFAIDEGKPEDVCELEQLPQDSNYECIVNIGHLGNTGDAIAPQPNVQVTGFQVGQQGDALEFIFDVGTNIDQTWLKLEYNDGEFHEIQESEITGEDVVRGAKGLRVPTGSARRLIWPNARSSFGGNFPDELSFRVTVSHGRRTANMLSETIALENALPVVLITSPNNGEYIPGYGSQLTTAASSQRGEIANIQLYYKLAEAGSYTALILDNEAPFNFSPDIRHLQGQTIDLRVRAVDTEGNSSFSEPIRVTVCSSSINPTMLNLPYGGGTGFFTISSNHASCPWQISGETPWFRFTPPTQGTGDATIGYEFTPNLVYQSWRNANITFNDSLVSIRQDDGPPPNVTLSLLKTGSGKGTVTFVARGVTCGSDCSSISERVPMHSTMELVAVPAEGSKFDGFTGYSCEGTSCNVWLNGNLQITASFSSTVAPTPTPTPTPAPSVPPTAKLYGFFSTADGRLSTLNLVSKAGTATSVYIRAYSETGQLIKSKRIILAANEKHTESINQLVSLRSLSGYLEIEGPTDLSRRLESSLLKIFDTKLNRLTGRNYAFVASLNGGYTSNVFLLAAAGKSTNSVEEIASIKVTNLEGALKTFSYTVRNALGQVQKRGSFTVSARNTKTLVIPSANLYSVEIQPQQDNIRFLGTNLQLKAFFKRTSCVSDSKNGVKICSSNIHYFHHRAACTA